MARASGSGKKRNWKGKSKRRNQADGGENGNLDKSDVSDDYEPAPLRVKRIRTAKSQGKISGSRSVNEALLASDEEDMHFGRQEVVGHIAQAPEMDHVSLGQISQNTLDFLSKLKDPMCNDRDWFKLHEPIYRQAEKEWKNFVEDFTDLLTAVDSQVPPLPPKDVIHRIYRDVRFSNDKTPYKTGFSAGFSRSGRKGIFAGLKPGGESIIAAGSWCPARNELATIRSNILQSSTRLRHILSSPEFVNYFGKPERRKDGGRQSIFGMEDELKVAPKGIDKEHNFADTEVLAPDFKYKLVDMVRITRPFVHCLNDLMTITGGGSGANGDSEEGSGEGNDDGD